MGGPTDYFVTLNLSWGWVESVTIKSILLSKICQHWPLDILENLEPPADCTDNWYNWLHEVTQLLLRIPPLLYLHPLNQEVNLIKKLRLPCREGRFLQVSPTFTQISPIFIKHLIRGSRFYFFSFLGLSNRQNSFFFLFSIYIIILLHFCWPKQFSMRKIKCSSWHCPLPYNSQKFLDRWGAKWIVKCAQTQKRGPPS